MTRRLLSLFLTLGTLAACNDKPPGQLEPIPRPADYKEPAKAEAPRPAPKAPPADPNKVMLRWNLAPDAPVAYRLDGTPTTATFYALQRPKQGDLRVRIGVQGAKDALDQGTFSERGFILDGLGGVHRNVATLLLELPKEAVGVGDTWSLGADLVDTTLLGRSFVEKKADRRNTVKLVAIAPEGDDRVATIEYDLFESLSGSFPPALVTSAEEPAEEPAETSPLKPAKDKGKGKGKDKEPAKAATSVSPERPLTAEATFTGKGEFLVKAGRWRSWEGTLSSKLEGYTPPSPEKSPTQVPPGTLQLKLTALDAVPPALQEAEARK
ncbi:hypothetical protein [Hyalangium gracile]|uniref:hypothetical protein n=1 Tax=Hyalangium gracile TaxID=394092 RepID=UPI001CC9920A|nr:hypothetical protein [Hyalangium gracile]